MNKQKSTEPIRLKPILLPSPPRLPTNQTTPSSHLVSSHFWCDFHTFWFPVTNFNEGAATIACRTSFIALYRAGSWKHALLFGARPLLAVPNCLSSHSLSQWTCPMLVRGLDFTFQWNSLFVRVIDTSAFPILGLFLWLNKSDFTINYPARCDNSMSESTNYKLTTHSSEELLRI